MVWRCGIPPCLCCRSDAGWYHGFSIQLNSPVLTASQLPFNIRRKESVLFGPIHFHCYSRPSTGIDINVPLLASSSKSIFKSQLPLRQLVQSYPGLKYVVFFSNDILRMMDWHYLGPGDSTPSCLEPRLHTSSLADFPEARVSGSCLKSKARFLIYRL